MEKPITLKDLKNLKENLDDALEEDRKYWLVNAVKCDAIQTAKTYEEFSDRVAGAHLQPLEKSDKKPSSLKTVWNVHAERKSD